MRLGASSGALLATGLTSAAFALTFFLLVWPLKPVYAIGLGFASTAFTLVAFAGAWRAHYRPERITSTDPPQIVLDCYFSPDETDPRPQGIFIQVIGSPARDIRVQPFGMKGSDVTFDEIALLLPGDPPRQLVPRFRGHAKTIWEVAAFIGLAKVQPVRIARTVKGRMTVTSVPSAPTSEHRRMPLRIKYRDTVGRLHVNEEYYLQFAESSSGVSLDTRLISRREPAPDAQSAG
jgi:hypothetical protein